MLLHDPLSSVERSPFEGFVPVKLNGYALCLFVCHLEERRSEDSDVLKLKAGECMARFNGGTVLTQSFCAASSALSMVWHPTSCSAASCTRGRHDSNGDKKAGFCQSTMRWVKGIAVCMWDCSSSCGTFHCPVLGHPKISDSSRPFIGAVCQRQASLSAASTSEGAPRSPGRATTATSTSCGYSYLSTLPRTPSWTSLPQKAVDTVRVRVLSSSWRA
jgi:hypothetical protein